MSLESKAVDLNNLGETTTAWDVRALCRVTVRMTRSTGVWTNAVVKLQASAHPVNGPWVVQHTFNPDGGTVADLDVSQLLFLRLEVTTAEGAAGLANAVAHGDQFQVGAGAPPESAADTARDYVRTTVGPFVLDLARSKDQTPPLDVRHWTDASVRVKTLSGTWSVGDLAVLEAITVDDDGDPYVATGDELDRPGPMVVDLWGKSWLRIRVKTAQSVAGQVEVYVHLDRSQLPLIPISPLTTKGDLSVFDGALEVRKGVGADNTVLAADSSDSSGVAWKTTAALLDPDYVRRDGTTPMSGTLQIDSGSALKLTPSASTVTIGAGTLGTESLTFTHDNTGAGTTAVNYVFEGPGGSGSLTNVMSVAGATFTASGTLDFVAGGAVSFQSGGSGNIGIVPAGGVVTLEGDELRFLNATAKSITTPNQTLTIDVGTKRDPAVVLTTDAVNPFYRFNNTNATFAATVDLYVSSLAGFNKLTTAEVFEIETTGTAGDQHHIRFDAHAGDGAGSPTAIIFNDDGRADVDVRMEGSSDTDLFFLDGSTNRIGISVASPDTLFHVGGDFHADGEVKSDSDVYMTGGNWNDGHLNLGGFHCWHDSTNGAFRFLAGAPSAEADSGSIGITGIAPTDLSGSAATVKLASITGPTSGQSGWLEVYIGGTKNWVPRYT